MREKSVKSTLLSINVGLVCRSLFIGQTLVQCCQSASFLSFKLSPSAWGPQVFKFLEMETSSIGLNTWMVILASRACRLVLPVL